MPLCKQHCSGVVAVFAWTPGRLCGDSQCRTTQHAPRTFSASEKNSLRRRNRGKSKIFREDRNLRLTLRTRQCTSTYFEGTQQSLYALKSCTHTATYTPNSSYPPPTVAPRVALCIVGGSCINTIILLHNAVFATGVAGYGRN